MSKVMQALENSERSHHHASGQFAQRPSYFTSAPKPSFSFVKAVSLVMLPPLIVFGAVTYHTYQTAKQDWLAENVAQSVVIEVPFEYQVTQAPNFGSLSVTYRENPISDNSDWLVEPEVGDNVQPKTLVDVSSTKTTDSSDDLLSGLDLSQLSPELAQRFESALNGETKQTHTARNEQASNLSHQAERWYGKLPAMNFQTHVYSSKPTKRWVKINGVEYNQGDWVSDEIELVAIEQQSCLIRYRGELIEVPALYDWKG